MPVVPQTYSEEGQVHLSLALSDRRTAYGILETVTMSFWESLEINLFSRLGVMTCWLNTTSSVASVSGMTFPLILPLRLCGCPVKAPSNPFSGKSYTYS